MKLAKFEKNDNMVQDFLKSEMSNCPLCGKKYYKIGWTSMMGMRTGINFGCNKGHKKEPRQIIVPLSGKGKYFNGIMFS